MGVLSAAWRRALRRGLPMDEASRMARAREMGARWTDGEGVAQPPRSLGDRNLAPGAVERRGDAESVSAGSFQGNTVYERADEIAAALASAYPDVHIGRSTAFGGGRGVAGRSGSAAGQSAYISTPWGEVRVSDHAAGMRPEQLWSFNPLEQSSPSDALETLRPLIARAEARAVRVADQNTPLARRDYAIAIRLGRGESPEAIARNIGSTPEDVIAARERHLLRSGPESYAVLPNGNIRSINAAFDPANEGSADLLGAWLLGVPVGGGLLSAARRDRRAT